MNKNNTPKALALVIVLAAMLLPTAARAQAYDREAAESYNGGAFYELIAYDTYLDELANVLKAVELNRGSASISGGSITNDDFGTSPLGSGLGILLAAGAGYAALCRKRSRKNTTLLLACLLLLGFTQCKKEQIEPQGGKVSITLNVENGSKATDGAKVEVNPPHVNFETGDKILVAHDGKYVGTLTYTEYETDKYRFQGDIDATVAEPKQKLYFYFLGNKQNDASLTAGTTTSCTVNISDQTGYPALPVISFSASNENYNGAGTYTARLHNKASLMKFNVTTPSNSPICITGMNNKVIVDFSKAANDGENNGFTYDKEDGGIIKLKGGSGSPAEKWAIVLPQGEVTTATANAGFGSSAAFTVPEINANMYYDTGVDVADIPLTKTLNYTGDVQTFTVPATGYYTLECYGAQGGYSSSGLGGKGGMSQLTYPLTQGDVLYIYVGGQGEFIDGSSSHPEGGDGGWNGGGKGGTGVAWGGGNGNPYNGGGGGGGATHIATSAIGPITNSTDFTSNHTGLILIAGGGGGGLSWGSSAGGAGGGDTGGNGHRGNDEWNIAWNNGTLSCGRGGMTSSNGGGSCEGCGGGGAGYQGGNTWTVTYNASDQSYSGAGGSSWGDTTIGKGYSTTSGGATTGGNGKAVITWYGAIYSSR